MMNLIPKPWKKRDTAPARIDDFFNRWTSLLERDPFFSEGFESFSSVPSVDVEETENEVLVRAEIPGMDKEHFNLELKNDHLILRGEKKKQEESKEHNYHRVECAYGQFSRAIPLPTEVKEDGAEAEYKDGVLIVHLPKSENGKLHQIEIKVN